MIMMCLLLLNLLQVLFSADAATTVVVAAACILGQRILMSQAGCSSWGMVTYALVVRFLVKRWM